MSDVSDAKPRDVYVDQYGRLWRVVGRWDEPVVIMEQVDIPANRQTAGVNGLLWDGFKRIYRETETSHE